MRALHMVVKVHLRVLDMVVKLHSDQNTYRREKYKYRESVAAQSGIAAETDIATESGTAAEVKARRERQRYGFV